jgi:dienelactone hydrolase
MSELADARLRPLALYQAIYADQPRQFAMPETADPLAWNDWRAAFRARLVERLGGFPSVQPPIPVVAERPTAQDGYQRTYLEFESAPGVIAPAWLLIPDGLSRPAPAVIALHGHGYGADELVGIGLDGRTRDEPEGYHQDFAVALCRRGLVVLAPELRGFGRRREPQDREEGPTISSCQQAAWWGVMLGHPLLGSRVWDVLRALDLLEARPEVDAGRIGIMGGSGGGAAALFAAALDQRLRAAVISNYFCTFKDSILAIKHCHCNYVPGILQDAEMADIAALIAPRPLLIQTGADDQIFPLAGVLAAYQRLHSAYRALGASDQLRRDVFAGGHQINGAPAYEFLSRQLEEDIT